MSGADTAEQDVITALSPSRRDPRRVDVFVGGVRACQLTDVVVAEQGLHVGQAVTPADLAALDHAERLAQATDRALRYLSHRPRSVHEIRERLGQYGIEPPTIDTVLERLAGWGYVGDERFAAYWVENRATHQPRGKRLLEHELRHKGVDQATIGAALATSALDEDRAAVALARTRLRRLAGLDRRIQRQRLGAFLLRRGYDYGTVKHALDIVLAEREEGVGDLTDSDSYDAEVSPDGEAT